MPEKDPSSSGRQSLVSLLREITADSDSQINWKEIAASYIGKILDGDHSDRLKTKVAESLLAVYRSDKNERPVAPYLTAFEAEEGGEIWHEAMSGRAAEMLGCRPNEMAGILQSAKSYRKIYYQKDGEKVEEEIVSGEDLANVEVRKKLREANVEEGRVRIFYEVEKTDGETVWLKDEAKITLFEKDGVYLSEGSLLETTGEMFLAVENRRLIDALTRQHARLKEKVDRLSGILPICASCKSIRDDKGRWQQIEGYIRDHSDAEFSHGICPDCVKKLYPDLDL